LYDIPFILLAFIAIGVFAGIYIDKFFNLNIPVFTLIFTLLGVAGGIYSILRRLNK